MVYANKLQTFQQTREGTLTQRMGKDTKLKFYEYNIKAAFPLLWMCGRRVTTQKEKGNLIRQQQILCMEWNAVINWKNIEIENI